MSRLADVAGSVSEGIAMRRLAFALAVWFAALALSPAGALADFAAGVAAYDKGDYATALEEWQPLAEQGSANAQFALGALYYDGKGVFQDYREAGRWHRKAAEQGLASAQYVLGIMYRHGEGFPKDFAKAARWHREAAEQGHAEAQLSLGILYHNGRGVPLDLDEAMRWYNRAAESGLVEAQLVLGQAYMDGDGVRRSYIHAHKWFNIASARGHPDGISNRDLAAQELTPEEIAVAQDLAKTWWETHMR